MELLSKQVVPSLLGLMLCPCSPAFPGAELGMVSWECFAFA